MGEGLHFQLELETGIAEGHALFDVLVFFGIAEMHQYHLDGRLAAVAEHRARGDAGGARSRTPAAAITETVSTMDVDLAAAGAGRSGGDEHLRLVI